MNDSNFRRIGYLDWLRRHVGRVRYDLAMSNVRALTAEELELDGVQLHSTHRHGNEELYEMLAHRYRVPKSHVFVCHGGTQAIYLTLGAILEPGVEVIVETPRYEALRVVPESMGARISTVERWFRLNLDSIRVTEDTRALVMTNLHNPSGVATDARSMEKIGAILRGVGAWGVVSEVYLDSCTRTDVKPAALCGRNLISIGSLSKVYGLGGVRGGWIIAASEVIERVRDAADHVLGGTAVPTEQIMTAAFRKSEAILRRTREITRRNFAVVREWLEQNPRVRMVEPDGGTVCLLKLPEGVPAMELAERLRRRHSTLVVPGNFFAMPGYVRIACGGDEEILREGLVHVSIVLDQMAVVSSAG